jgi:hypothetical protein
MNGAHSTFTQSEAMASLDTDTSQKVQSWMTTTGEEKRYWRDNVWMNAAYN